MKKLVLKTTLFTLLAVLCTLAILFGIFTLFFPKNIASVADQMGNYGVSVFYYEKAYAKSNSVKDLYELVLKLDEETDSEKTSKYANELLNRDDFNEVERTSSPTTKEYVSAKYAMSTFLKGDVNSATDFCENYVLAYGYSEYNPFTVSVGSVVKNLSKDAMNVVLQGLESVKTSLKDAVEIALLEGDVSLINSFING